MRRSHTITTQIKCSLDEAYAYLANPRNFAEWAAVDPQSYRKLPNGDWVGLTSAGLRHFRFAPLNDYGVLDHAMFVPGGALMYTPMRVVTNDGGCEVLFTFHCREGMTDLEFDSTLEWISTDFLTLKSVLESRSKGTGPVGLSA
ncbi:hypothetical protein [Devosia sp.]|uniref:hypothetical protein n=1 Tax=Devosia sp. TaxID=1871048 RepID=UPI003263E974